MPRRTKITVALASQYASIGSLIRHYLTESQGITVSWEATTAEETFRLSIKHPPTLLILSPTFRDASAPELIGSYREKYPETKLLLFAGVLHHELVDQTIAAGVHGIVSASSPLPTLLTGINLLLEGACYFDGVAEGYFHNHKQSYCPLSKREKTVLHLVADGLSTKEIASELGICVKTAEKFRERIMKKLDVHDVVRLTRYAIRTGISTLE